MRFIPMSSWLGLRVGWRLLKEIKKHNRLCPLKTRNPPLSLTLNSINPTTPSTPLKIQELTRDEIVERKLKVLCYNCDGKYFLGHKCKEQNIFMAISEDILEEDVETPLVSQSLETTNISPP
jgi:hypothetical protein